MCAGRGDEPFGNLGKRLRAVGSHELRRVFESQLSLLIVEDLCDAVGHQHQQIAATTFPKKAA